MLPQNTPYYSGGCWEYVAQTGLPGLAAGTSLAHGWSAGAMLIFPPCGGHRSRYE